MVLHNCNAYMVLIRSFNSAWGKERLWPGKLEILNTAISETKQTQWWVMAGNYLVRGHTGSAVLQTPQPGRNYWSHLNYQHQISFIRRQKMLNRRRKLRNGSFSCAGKWVSPWGEVFNALGGWCSSKVMKTHGKPGAMGSTNTGLSIGYAFSWVLLPDFMSPWIWLWSEQNWVNICKCNK